MKPETFNISLRSPRTSALSALNLLKNAEGAEGRRERREDLFAGGLEAFALEVGAITLLEMLSPIGR